MLVLSLLLLAVAQAVESSPIELRIEAPPGLFAEKSRLESYEARRLADVARLVGIPNPGAPISVDLAPNSSDWARYVPAWTAGFAIQDRVVIFPSRSPSYPDDTLDDVLRHEVAHALIWRASSGRPIPRWFNEGLALAAERGWKFRDQTQLFMQLVSGSRLSLDELDRLFAGGQSDQRRAYLISGALVQGLLAEHGDTAGGRILEKVGRGVPFQTAFADVAGQSPSAVEAEFWTRQRVWTTWIPILFSQETLWLVITLLAIVAIQRRRKRNAEMRKRWEEEEEEEEEE
jgi:hypothetical protein